MVEYHMTMFAKGHLSIKVGAPDKILLMKYKVWSLLRIAWEDPTGA